MRFSTCRRQLVATTLLFYTQIASTTTTTATSGITATPPTSSSQPSIATCEARTINYITHRLPQQCLKSSWHHVNGTASTQTDGGAESTGLADTAEILIHTTDSGIQPSSTDGSDGTQETTNKAGVPEEKSAATSTASATVSSEEPIPTKTVGEEDPAFGDATFISFEDWKQQNLEKVGQSPEIGERRQKPGGRDRDAIHNALDSFGDEGEISLDFMGFTGHGSDETSTLGKAETGTAGNKAQETPAVKHRSKDAGTTCKERFNYASFDAGSTIKKANPEAKSATKILSENKDSYMLNECSASNKFFIVELSDDILVDTVVLANFEFFSSQFRQFRVSVSDRYPVKLDRWVDLGTYEAQNARGIQAFLVEEPKIWARYLKIEFITHFGKEYYCPISLLRVHGRTMISEFRAAEEEARGEADSEEEIEGSLEEAGEKLIPEAVAAVVIEEKLAEQLKGAQAALGVLKDSEALAHTKANQSLGHISEPSITQWSKPDLRQWPLGSEDSQVCFGYEEKSISAGTQNTEVESSAPVGEAKKGDGSSSTMSSTYNSEEVDVPHKTELLSASTVSSSLIDKLSKTVSEMKETVKTLASSSSATGRVDNATAATAENMTVKTSQSHWKPNATASNPPTPTPSTQESFFKTVHKRLQFLEANSTLSLQYIESQSALLRDAFQKVEKRQLAKTTSFLESLNETVMNELRGFRQQYDQIWQSTVIELESQRERSERDILEVSRRMTLLADEVIFQKRMSIAQSCLLLLCLGLVLFQNRGQRGYLELPMGNMRHMLRGRYGSLTPNSPSPSPSPTGDEKTFLRGDMLRPDLRHASSSWEQRTHKRVRSYDSVDESDPSGRSSTFEESPFSMYSKPLPESGSSSSPQRGLDDNGGSLGMGLGNGNIRASPLRWSKGMDDDNPTEDEGFIGSFQSGRPDKYPDIVTHPPNDQESGDSDPYRLDNRYNQRPGFPKTSTVIRHEIKASPRGDGTPNDAQSYYVTPPPEVGLTGLTEQYHSGHGIDAHIQPELAGSGIRTNSTFAIARKPLPELPAEDDDESDEDTT